MNPRRSSLVPRHVCDILEDQETAHMDDTFKVFPVIYALMTSKTRHLYEKILSYVKDASLPGIRMDTIMSGYKTAMRVAAVTVFRQTRLRGFWFHYTKALFKKSRAPGFQTNQETKKLVKMIMVLLLLPEEQILPGIEILEKIPDTSSRPHPNIWVLIEKLQMMEYGKTIDLERLDAGHVQSRHRRLRYVHFDQRIQRAQELLTDTGDVRSFLIYISHSIQLLILIADHVQKMVYYQETKSRRRVPRFIAFMEDLIHPILLERLVSLETIKKPKRKHIKINESLNITLSDEMWSKKGQSVQGSYFATYSKMCKENITVIEHKELTWHSTPEKTGNPKLLNCDENISLIINQWNRS
ncbi:hypothetical protein CBL_20756 [Carabus blaptoides fortunei]